jgi:hypothetical protein
VGDFPIASARELAAIDALEARLRGRWQGWAVEPSGLFAVDVLNLTGEGCHRVRGKSLAQALRLTTEAVEAGRC